ncbi:MAG: hypothetical protein R3305_04640 [Gammaproteobacteria bacterium]|nr:hypothetical protein [Gammaproteobacteria bacterium]
MNELDEQRIESQIEAYADGSLEADAKRRIEQLMRDDPSLARRVEQARALRRELRKLGRAPVPRGLRSRLMRIAKPAPSPGIGLIPAAGLAAVATIAFGLGFFASQPLVSLDPNTRAINDFQIAMAYLQRSAVLTQGELNDAVGYGMRNAFAVSRDALTDSLNSTNEGESDNAE